MGDLRCLLSDSLLVIIGRDEGASSDRRTTTAPSRALPRKVMNVEAFGADHRSDASLVWALLWLAL